MTDTEFWSLIDMSRERAKGNPDRQKKILHRLLKACSADDVAEFKVRYDNLIRKAYRWDLWGAAYVIGGGCSNDGFWEFRSWLVSRGKRVYNAALKNPESLVRVIRPTDNDRGRKNFLNPAPFVWEELTGRDMSDCPRLGSNLGEDAEGQEWDDEDLPTLFPKLWKKFGWQRRTSIRPPGSSSARGLH